MITHLITAAMSAAEQKRLPDAAIRFGIRCLLKQRLEELQAGGVEAFSQRMRVFLDSAQAGPVALVPEKANAQHYEVPDEFFVRSLGERLKYSCCYWPDGVDSLDAAEIAALEQTCERAELTDGMQILELGCGWGSLSLWMAEHYPNSQITSVSNSHSQRDYIVRQAATKGINNLTVITADMNDFHTDETFDRVVSVEMFEHMRNHAELMRRISTWLKADGRLFVHIFCHKQFAYPYESNGPGDWMAEHFFSGGMMPSDSLFLNYSRDLQIRQQWRWRGQHYARTCRAWLNKMDADRAAIMRLFAETYGRENARLWYQRWRIFHMACEELFAWNNGSEWYVSHYLFDRRQS